MPLPFILWTLVKDDKSPDGKMKKLPLSFGGKVINPHNPKNHQFLPWDKAQWYRAQVPGAMGVGGVITEGYFLIDLDHAWVNGKWSDLAVEACQRFPDAYKEISQSGEGLHILGRCTIEHHHKKKVGDVEFYSRGRFVALTGTQATGDWETDYTQEVHAFVNDHLGWETDKTDPKSVWTTEEVDGAPAWSDAELLERALKSKSAAAIMGNAKHASFYELWENDVEALAKFYPANNGRPYDYSAADLGLAQHLMYWASKNCQRVHDLMWQSKLVRPKWDRADYMHATIGKAYLFQGETAQDRKRAPPVPPAEAAAAAPPGSFLVVSDYPAFFDGCVWVEDRELIAVPGGALLNKGQFDHSTRYGGRRFMLDEQKVVRSAWEACNNSSGFRPQSANAACFRPELASMAIIEENGQRMINTYVPVRPHSEPGDVKPFLDHLEKLLPDRHDRALLLCYLASLVQNPGMKFTWWPLLIGVEGNGKSFIGTAMTYCVGAQYTHVANAQDLANKFNGWVDRKLLVIIEEIAVRDRLDMADALKVLVTNLRIEIQRKGKDQVTGDNRANGLTFSNHPDAIRKTANDRRIATFYTAQREVSDLVRDGMDAAYFNRLWAWFENGGGAYLLHYLLTLPIPAEMDPAKDLKRAPTTSTTAEIIEASRTVPEQLILEAVAAGQQGFRGGFVSSTYIRALLAENRIRLAPGRWEDVMRQIGYERHPALINGRLNNVVQPDGVKPVVFVKKGTIQALNLRSPSEVADAYSRAQREDPAAAAIFGGAAKAGA